MKKISLKLSLIAIVTIAGLLTISSCSKTDDNASFVGTYTGNTVTGTSSSPDTVVITAGGSATAVSILERKNGVTLAGTVSGSTLTIPSQSVSIAGSNYPASGTGALSGNTLTVNLTEVIASVNVNSVFTGTK